MLKKEKLYRFFLFISLNEFMSFVVSIWARTFPLNGMRSQLKERSCLFLIRKQQLTSYMLRVL